jgi:hypothetical protein
VLAHQIWLDLWSTAPVPGLICVTTVHQLQDDDLIVTLSAEEDAAPLTNVARREARREPVERLNEIAGDQLVYWADFGGSDSAGSLRGWLASKGRLRTYLLGLQTANLITKEQYEEAERCVASLEQ